MQKVLLSGVGVLAIATAALAWRVHGLEQRLLELHIQQSFTGTELARLRGHLTSTRVLLGLPEEEASQAEEAASLRRWQERTRD